MVINCKPYENDMYLQLENGRLQIANMRLDGNVEKLKKAIRYTLNTGTYDGVSGYMEITPIAIRMLEKALKSLEAEGKR